MESKLWAGRADLCLFRELQNSTLLLGSRTFYLGLFSTCSTSKPTEKMPYSCGSEDVMTVVPLDFNELFIGASSGWNGELK